MSEVKKYVLVKDGVITNIIVWDGQTLWNPDNGETVMDFQEPMDVGMNYAEALLMGG